MKYRDLIQFDPIESVIVLRSADNKQKAEELVRSYVMSDDMADLVNGKIISQLRLENVVDNKGVLLVGNYGTGKSHLMSVISSVAGSQDLLTLAQNEQFKRDAACIAGRFEILRIEIGSTTMSLRGIITSNIERDLAQRGISFKFPDVSTITNNKDALLEMMAVFAEKYGDERGYLIVVDELLDYLRFRKDIDLILDFAFMRELGEVIKESRFRFIGGIQEALFENPAFRQASTQLLHMKDRFEQVLIRSEDIAYVAKRRVLRKSPEQKAQIREHLQQFCPLYQNMADRLEDYVDMFPIHPVYIDTFQHIITVEKREVLKTISETIAAIIDSDVDPMHPGIISYDTYWKRIKENPSLRTDPAVHEVLSKSMVLEDIINRNFPKAAYRTIALQIIYALSVHRLTTGTLDAKLGLTPQNLKDDLCLYIPMPVMEEDFLLSTIVTVLHDILNTVSGQFIECSSDNGQYYLDLKKDIDYDKKIQEKADFLGNDALNRYFFEIIIATLEWNTPQHVAGYHIYQYNLNWHEKNLFRRGYLFLGNSADRPTAQPKEDFYVYILPPFGSEKPVMPTQRDEVYFALQYDLNFAQLIRLYGGAKEMEAISAAGETKTTYVQRGKSYLSKIRRWLEDNKTRLFKITYQGMEKPILDYLKGVRMNELTVKSAVDIAASHALSAYFNDKYPEYPRFPSVVTVQNILANRTEALNVLLGRPTQLGTSILEALGLMLDAKIRPENSKYASYYIQKLNSLPEGNVLNFADIMESPNGDEYVDRRFGLDAVWMSVILATLVYGGHCVLVAADNTRYDAGNMEALCKVNPMDIYGFKRLEKPKSMNRQMLTRLFDALNVPSGLLASESTYPQALQALLREAQAHGNRALTLKQFLAKNVPVWGEMLIPVHVSQQLQEQITAVHKCTDDIRSRFTTPAKLKNFDYDEERMSDLERGMSALASAERAFAFYSETQEIMQYIATAESKVPENAGLRPAFEANKAAFMALRGRILDEDYDAEETDDLIARLDELKAAYINFYLAEHKKFRLDHAGAMKKGKIQESVSLKALHSLRSIKDILPLSQLNDLTDQLSAIKTCYELTALELQSAPDCPHCHFNPVDNLGIRVEGRLESIENLLDDLLNAWTQQLLCALDDPMLEDQRKLLSKKQQEVIARFTSTRSLPIPVDQQFIDCVNAMLSGMESVELPIDELHKAMASWSPCAPEEFKARMIEWIDQRIRGRDKSKVRIVIK